MLSERMEKRRLEIKRSSSYKETIISAVHKHNTVEITGMIWGDYGEGVCVECGGIIAPIGKHGEFQCKTCYKYAIML